LHRCHEDIVVIGGWFIGTGWGIAAGGNHLGTESAPGGWFPGPGWGFAAVGNPLVTEIETAEWRRLGSEWRVRPRVGQWRVAVHWICAATGGRRRIHMKYGGAGVEINGLIIERGRTQE